MPLITLVIGALGFPWIFMGPATLSHRAVAISVLISALLLLVLGAIMLGGIYELRGSDVGAALTVHPMGTVFFLLNASLKMTLVWVPVLALVWFVLAQGVERRRGEAIARADAGIDR